MVCRTSQKMAGYFFKSSMKEYFYIITEGMIDLGLRSTELNLFAIIFGYSQKGDGCCYATRGELARRCGVSSIRTIDSAMDSLIEKGLVKKTTITKEGKSLVAYYYDANSAQGVQKLHTPPVQKLHIWCAKSAHKEIIKEKKEIENIPPTPQAVADYCKGRGFVDPEGFADFYCTYNDNRNWTKSNGEPILNWKNNIITNWESRHKNEKFTRSTAVDYKPFDLNKFKI